jgi:hypothetical protein
MSRGLRHELITLHSEVREEDFERFMEEELIPFFKEHYGRVTRKTITQLKSQYLLQDDKDRRNWLWVTVWSRGGNDIRGSTFENTLMERLEETEDMMKKLESFGKRASEKVFDEIVNTDSATNT